MFFTAPADVRNTSFLSYSYSDGKKDDQWIYLPALGRVRRIASDKSNDSFMGSDFTYDDMGARHPSSDTHKILREEKLQGWDCYVVESVPKEPNDEFAKTISWVIKDELIGLKKEYLDIEGSVVRTLTIDEVSFNNNLRDSFFSERQRRIGPRS